MDLTGRDDHLLQMTTFLHDNSQWSAFWDKRYEVWRVSEDDPYSDLYAEDKDISKVIEFMAAHSHYSRSRQAERTERPDDAA